MALSIFEYELENDKGGIITLEVETEHEYSEGDRWTPSGSSDNLNEITKDGKEIPIDVVVRYLRMFGARRCDAQMTPEKFKAELIEMGDEKLAENYEKSAPCPAEIRDMMKDEGGMW